jgi:hypothetical protein
VQNYCASAPYTPPDQPNICSPTVLACSATVTTNCRGIPSASNPNPSSCSSDPLVAYKSDQVSYPNVTVASSSQISGGGNPAYLVTFNPLGRIYANSDGSFSLDRITLSNSKGSKQWQIQIASASGSLRLCDPTSSASPSLACPAQQ